MTQGLTVLKKNPARSISGQSKVRGSQFVTAEEIDARLPKAPALRPFTITLVNAHATLSEIALLWNANTIVTGLTQGADITIATITGPTYANLLKTLAGAPFIVAGFQYSVANKLQFDQAFIHYRGNIDGQQDQNPINAAIVEQRKASYDDQTLLDIPYVTKITQFDCWAITVRAVSTVTLTFKPIPESQVRL